MLVSPTSKNHKFSDFLKKDSLLNSLNKNSILMNNTNNNIQNKNIESRNTSISNLKDLKITTDTLDKAPNLLKKLLSPKKQSKTEIKSEVKSEVNFKLTAKVVNINLISEDSKIRKRDDNSVGSTRSSGFTSPFKTIRGDDTKNNNSFKLNSSMGFLKQTPKASTISSDSNIYVEENVSLDENNKMSNIKFHNNEKNSNNKINNRNFSNSGQNFTHSNMNNTNISFSGGNKKNENVKDRFCVNNTKFDDKAKFEREIIDNKNIVCINVNKKKVVGNNGKDGVIVKKTVYYANGSTDEWLFKE